MNTVQEPLSAPFPPPCSAAPNRTDLPTSKANNNANANPAALDPLRCEFTSSDGRRCRMPRASLCTHHASKALSCGEKATNRMRFSPLEKSSPELPELQALCGDLTTATNINRALAQVFLLMAQGRIAQKQAVAFGYLAQLLLQTVPGIRSEFVSAFGYHPWEEKLKRSLQARQEDGNPVPPEPPAAQPFDSRPADRRTEPVTSPDYASLLSRSQNLFDGKYDATPEGRREANALVTELELMQPPASKPPKGTRASVIEHMKRWMGRGKAPASGAPSNASRRRPTPTIIFDPPPRLPQIPRTPTSALAAPSPEPPATRRPETPAEVSSTAAELPAPNKLSSPLPRPAPTAETKPRENHFAAPPSRRHAEPEFPVTRVDWHAPPSWSKTRKPAPFPSRAEKAARKLRGMTNYRLRHLQHLNSRGL